jgi:vitamin B12 transporter
MDRFYFNPSYQYKNGNVTLKAGYQKVNRDFKSDYPFQTSSENTQIEIFNNFVFGDKFFTVIGALFQHNFIHNVSYQNSTQKDIFANVVVVPNSRFRLNLGGRLNGHSTYGNNLTYSINPSYTFVKTKKLSVKILTALSSAFIAPSLYQLYDTYSGNENLKPEENQSLEMGFVINYAGWDWSANYFQRNETPSLLYDLSSYRYENSDEDITYSGLEFQLSGLITSKFKFNQNITLIETEEGDLRYLPRFSSQTELSYDVSNHLFMSLRLQAIGKRFGLDNETILNRYELVNFSVRHNVKETPLSIFIHVINLFNAKYTEIEGYSTRGRNLIAGLSYSFQ